MSELRKPYIKLWAAEALLSDDLASLSDHEERVYWRLSMVASLEEERWITRESPGLHRKCLTTAPKFAKAIARLEQLGMVERMPDGRILVTNGKKWNERTDRKPAPSDSPERVRERVARHRNETRNEDVTASNDSLQADVTATYRKEEEKEKEEEKDVARAETADAPHSQLSPRERDMFELVLMKCPQSIQRDPAERDAAADFARDFAGQEQALNEAVRELRRVGGYVAPANIRKHMPGYKPQAQRTASEPTPNQYRSSPRVVIPPVVLPPGMKAPGTEGSA